MEGLGDSLYLGESDISQMGFSLSCVYIVIKKYRLQQELH